MIRKILIAEDYESYNISVQKTLGDLNIPYSDYVYYCDDALVKIQKALEISHSYDLLITDLYFETDYKTQNISGGESLIIEARKLQPDLKILVFSATGKPFTIEALFNKQEIDGYVYKGRGDAKELKKAIECINMNRRYYPRQLLQQVKQSNVYELTDFDKTIVSLMTAGKRQQEISDYLKKNNIQPAGLSSIEKRLSQIKEALSFTTNEQLIAHCVKMGLV